VRILFDHQVFSLHDTGGVARYFYELGRHLPSEDGVAVEMAVGLNSSIYSFSALPGKTLRVYQMHTKMRAGVPRYIVNELLTNALGVARGRFDIYHSTYYRAAPLVRRRRLVASHFDCIHEMFPEMFRNSKTIIESKRRLYAAADAIICISESSRQDLLRYYSVDPGRTSVIHLGLTRFADYPRRKEEEAVKVEPYLLYVGARGGYKGFALLLDAFASSDLSRSYVLQAVGGGGFTDAESARITALGLANRVRLVPRASERTLAEMYRNASLFVYPSLYEGFGFPPLEAMSMGCPV
jgi:glycosyltransferase involved in cell wall biosynthesis